MMRRVVCLLLLLLCNFSFVEGGGDCERWSVPENHPAKRWLDKLFAKKGVPRSKMEFMQLGFRLISRVDSGGVLVFSHRACRDYLFKLYVECEISFDSDAVLGNRIEGAQKIARAIEEKGAQGAFKVPRKWLYHYCDERDGYRQTILIAEDMQILSAAENSCKWKSRRVKFTFLITLYELLKELVLIDSIYIDNIPFCRDGRVAFIDTEHYDSWREVDFFHLTGYLDPRVQRIWQRIVTVGAYQF